ncbi:MAG: Na+/H+ antiporter [Chitinophagaceae bacterium]
MENFKVVIFLMSILIGLSAVADKIRISYPILLVGTGLIVGFVPALPNLALDPEVVFLVFLPPLLHDAASHTSWHDFRSAIRPISTLAVTLVFFTTTSVAVAAHYLIPGFSWPLAFVLGAIVSPPDAVAATSITKGLGLNKRVITILEGESLLNDASALIAYRYAVAAVTSGSFILWKAGLQLLVVAGGGILIGFAVGFAFVFAYKKITNNSIVETSLTLLAPFLSYLLAEHFHTSGVLAVVTGGLFIAWRSPEVFSYQGRMQIRSVWDTLIFLLNGIIFILIGLQLPGILNALKGYSFWELLGYGLIVSAVTIFIRIIWVFVGAYHQNVFNWGRKKKTLSGTEDSEMEKNAWKNVLIVAWTGTRGVVSLATAMALPLVLSNGKAFPQRDIILFLAFVVIFVTLVVQGLSLPLLIRLLGVKLHLSPGKEEKELQLQMANSILDFIDHDFPINMESQLRDQLKKKYQLAAAYLKREVREHDKGHEDDDIQLTPLLQMLTAQLEIARFQRDLLIKFHKEGVFDDEVIRKVEQELDIEDMRLNNLMESQSKVPV